MTTHIMCDLETISKRPGGVVLAAAFVRFSDEAHCTLNLSIPDQEALGLEKDPDTMAWWNDQEAKHPGAWAAATTNPTPLATALPYFLEWIRWAAPDGDFLLWCHGATFDAPILGEVYRRAGIACPWTEQFWRVQCTRTLFNLSGVNPKEYAVPPPHVALNDAIGQTRAANAAMKILARAHQQPGGVT
ncbi:3'-5' exonuclease [Nitrobacteraceae bacterium UC4446_H13]